MEYNTLCGIETYNRFGGFGIKILISSEELYHIKHNEKVSRISNEVMNKLLNVMMEAVKDASPKTQIERESNRSQLIDEVFSNLALYVEEIPNEYCNQWCCTHLSWFIVTTKVGRIKIGWRKRVINIDWSNTIGTLSSINLFESENVTKGYKYIHAWSVEKAREYVRKIINSEKS